MNLQQKLVVSAIAAIVISTLSPAASSADSLYDAFSQGKVSADLRARYETVGQDNAVSDASAFTVRTRLGYTTADFDGWSFTVEMEDNRIALGGGDYTVGPTGYNLGEYSVIADPEFTELDQGFLQYKNENYTFKIGRQVIALDGHRFVGHVGWRQDRQTFDAVTAIFRPSKNFTAQYSYIDQRNRIFGEAADQDSKDHLLNISYITDFGKLTAYSYLLELDSPVDNSLDTYGISFNGKKAIDDIIWLYHLELASQSSDTATSSFDANYVFAELGAQFKSVTAKFGYEVLGSDDGNFGFATPLATLHKFNGWSDQFLGTPSQGLKDMYVSVSTAGFGGKWLAVMHKFEADSATTTVDDLGTELNLQYTTKFAKHYNVGIKYAGYKGDSGRVDADKVWVRLGTKF
jgi:hypothetical protein